MIAEAVAGIQDLANGALSRLRAARSGALVVADGHGRLTELGLRGSLFSAITAQAGVAPGTALSTTGAFTLSNPWGSGVNLVILSGGMGYISGTLGAGTVFWAYSPPVIAAIAGTAIAPIPAIVGLGVKSVAKPLTTSTIAAPVAIRAAFGLQASLASTAVAPFAIRDNVDGAIIVPPGAQVSLHAIAAAGTSPVVVFDCVWEEVPA